MRTIPDFNNTVDLSDMNGPKAYSRRNFIDEFVCSDARWRDEWFDSFGALTSVRDATAPVDVQDKDHERIAACAKSANIPGQLAFRLLPMISSITRAPVTA